jgi:Flp pilus assembly protein TadD
MGNLKHPAYPKGIRLRVLSLLTIAAVAGCNSMSTDMDLASFIQDSSQAAVQPDSSLDQKDRSDEFTRLFALARKSEEEGDVKNAMQQFTRLANEFPNQATAFHRLAVLHDQHGDPQESARFYRRAMQLAPKNANLLCDYAYSSYLSGNLEVAETSLRRAIELEPGLERAHNNLALVLARQGKDQEAIASFQNAGLTKRDAEENLRQARVAARLTATE